MPKRINEHKRERKQLTLQIPSPRFRCQAVDLLSPAHLKAMELKYSPKSPRTHFDYSDNYTAALALPVDDAILEQSKYDVNALFSVSHDAILEHAARRADLAFYTLVLYHNSNKIPQLGWTKIQHGRGRQQVTDAAHSSLTPNLVDTTINDKIPLDDDFDRHLKVKESMISGTHFMDSLNSTIELPKFVNEFDRELEDVYSCRQKTIAIIDTVAKGEMDPIEGIKAFFLMMQETFEKIKQDKRFSKSIFSNLNLKDDEPISLKGRLLDLSKKGTFINKWCEKSATVNDDYIYMLLRLKKEEIAQCKSSNKLKQKIIKKNILKIQKEISQTSSAHVHAHQLKL